MNFNEIFRKDMVYDNIKSHKEAGFLSLSLSLSLSRKYVSGKVTEGNKFSRHENFAVSQFRSGFRREIEMPPKNNCLIQPRN